jgi:hypothetical protein
MKTFLKTNWFYLVTILIVVAEVLMPTSHLYRDKSGKCTDEAIPVHWFTRHIVCDLDQRVYATDGIVMCACYRPGEMP